MTRVSTESNVKDLAPGDLVYVRSFHTQKAGLAKVLWQVRQNGVSITRICMGTEYYTGWDTESDKPFISRPGDELDVETYRLEEVREG